MLPELMYRSLERKRLPTVFPAKTFIERSEVLVKTLRMRGDVIRNELVKVKPLALMKAVTVTGSNFSGYRTTIRNAYVGRYGDELVYKVDYKSQLARPTMAKITQKMGDITDTINVLFMPEAPYTHEVKKTLTDPESLPCSSSVTSELGFFKYDSISETYNVGLFDDRYKPSREYPVSGADNAVLDIAYDWRVTNLVYPLPLPSGLTFNSMSVQLRSGFLSYEGKPYKDPGVNNTVRVLARIRNNTGTPITVKHWGLPLSVLYEDNRRVSQINVDVSFPDRTIPNGGYYNYYLDFNLPAWCYGRVAAAHAMSFYRRGLYFYGGGPLWQFEVFRLLLP